MRPLAALVLPPGLVIAFSSAAPSAHHSFASQFDNRVVMLHGVVASAEMINPHSFIHIDVTGADGTVERWALEGPGPLQITRRGLPLDLFKPGDSLGVCGYPAKNGARILQAAVLTMPAGDKLVWHNYRQGKCGLDQ
jgi:hypothetical protein